MDHERIERDALVERYHRGDLTADEEALFEEHFFSCPQCQARLEAAQDFQDGLRDVAARDAARAVGAMTAGAAGAASAVAARRRWLWPVALVLLAALPGWWLLFRDRDVVQEQVATVPERPAVEIDASIREVTELPVFLLTTLRSGDDEPATVISADQADGPLSLAVDAGDDSLDAPYDAYRVTILDAGGATLLRRDGLQPNALEVVSLTFPAGFLPPGTHRLVLEGVLEGGATEEIGRYRFQVEGER